MDVEKGDGSVMWGRGVGGVGVVSGGGVINSANMER